LYGAAAAAGAGLIRPAAVRAATKPRHMLVVLADGGWDVTFAFDPKLDVQGLQGPEVDLNPSVPQDVEEVRTFSDIQVVCNDYKRPAVTRFFENWSDRIAVVNGIWSESIVHQDSRARMLTGTKLVTSQDIATIVGHVHGTDKPLGTVDFSGRGFTGKLAASAGRVGATSQLRTLVDPASAFRAPPGATYSLPTVMPNDDASALVTSHLRSRLGSFQAPLGAANEQTIANLLESYDRRDRLVAEGASILSGLYPGYWPELSLQAVLAVDLLAKGLCQTVTLGLDGWDSHANNFVQHSLYEQLFLTLESIVNELVAADMLEDTMVVVVSEMGRTPHLNEQVGKDHWPHTSMMLLGGGVVGGRAYGATDDVLESRTMDLVSGEVTDSGRLLKYDNLAAGLLAGCDVDPEAWLPGVEVFRGAFV
jgi:hypothetical protein